MRSKTKLAVASAVAGVLLAGTLGAANAYAESGSTAKADRNAHKVIKFVAKPAYHQFFDVGEAGVSMGDHTVFSNDLYQNGVKVGFDAITCQVVRVEPERTIACDINVRLPEGDIFARLLRVEPLPPPPTPFYSAVTGGTGEYVGARGQIHLDPASAEEHYATVYLVR